MGWHHRESSARSVQPDTIHHAMQRKTAFKTQLFTFPLLPPDGDKPFSTTSDTNGQGNRKGLYRGCRHPDKHHSFMGNPILPAALPLRTSVACIRSLRFQGKERGWGQKLDKRHMKKG